MEEETKKYYLEFTYIGQDGSINFVSKEYEPLEDWQEIDQLLYELSNCLKACGFSAQRVDEAIYYG